MEQGYLPDRVKELIRSIGVAAGLPGGDAMIFADALVEADVHGAATHGVSRLNIYIRRIQKGLINPQASLTFKKNRSSVLAADAGNGLGQVQAMKVLEKLMSMARDSGIAAATICNSQHFGTLSYYCNKAAAQDMILFATTNCEPSMSPAGGREPYFGTNPLGVSFPTGKEFPIKIDLSTSVVARGNIIAAQKKGEPIPLGWALDEEGNPTTDASRALVGTVLTMAGHKGYALALMVEVFAGVLSGAAVGSDIGSMYKDMERKQDVGHFFCLFDIEAFMAVDEFKGRIDAMVDAIKANPRQKGVEEVLVPGERSHRRAVKNRRNGILIGDETLNEIKQLCDEYDVHFTL